MLIEDVDNIRVELEETEDTDQFITVNFFNADTNDELGSFRILKKRYDTFLLALNTMIREVYNVFEERQSSISKQVNKTTGTIEFVED